MATAPSAVHQNTRCDTGRLYTESTGIDPTRIIRATADIHSHRAQVLREMGIEVIEPEEPDSSKI